MSDVAFFRIGTNKKCECLDYGNLVPGWGLRGRNLWDSVSMLWSWSVPFLIDSFKTYKYLIILKFTLDSWRAILSFFSNENCLYCNPLHYFRVLILRRLWLLVKSEWWYLTNKILISNISSLHLKICVFLAPRRTILTQHVQWFTGTK